MTTPKDEKGAEPAGWLWKLNDDDNPNAGPVYMGSDKESVARIVAADEGAEVFPFWRHPPTSELDSAREATEVAANALVNHLWKTNLAGIPFHLVLDLRAALSRQKGNGWGGGGVPQGGGVGPAI